MAGTTVRAAPTTFATNRKIPHRKAGISHHLLQGAVEHARDAGASAIEGYPVDDRGKKVDLTMAYVGTRKLFESAGFEKVADTESTLDRFPRVLIRRALR